MVAVETVATHPLVSIRSSATVTEASRLMSDCGMGAIGVVDAEKRFVGIFTERDLTWLVAQGKELSSTPMTEVVNDFPVVVDGPLTVAEALERMRIARIRHLIVREGDDHRIVSMRDLVLAPLSQTPDEPTDLRLAARDVMSSPAIACRESAWFEETAEILADRKISGMPVVDELGFIVGVVSERDLAHALGNPLVRLAVGRHGHGPFLNDLHELPRSQRTIADIMTTPPVTAALGTPVEDLARIMVTEKINRIPIADQGRLLGVVTRGDILRSLAHMEHATVDVTASFVVVGHDQHDARVLL